MGGRDCEGVRERENELGRKIEVAMEEVYI